MASTAERRATRIGPVALTTLVGFVFCCGLGSPIAALAQLPPRLTLDYRGEAASRCPSPERVQRRLAQCLAPIAVYLPEPVTAVTRIVAGDEGLEARLYLTDIRGRTAGTRRLEGRGRSCRELTRDAVLALCFALERRDEPLFDPRRDAHTTTSSRPRRASLQYYQLPYPARPDWTADPPDDPLTLQTTAGAALITGLGPSATVGPTMAISLGARDWTIAAGGQWTGRSTRSIGDDGRVVFQSWYAHLDGCWWALPRADSRSLAICARASLGELRATPRGLRDQRETREPIAHLGPVIQFEFDLFRPLRLALDVGLHGRLAAPDVSVTSATGPAESVFRPWPVTITLGISLSVALF